MRGKKPSNDEAGPKQCASDRRALLQHWRTTVARSTRAAESGNREPDVDTLWAAAREAARPEFSGLAQRIVPRYGWDDLILPDKILGQLKHLEHYLAQQETVMNRWGGQKIRPRGYGIKALFSGGPGTGKTMCAEVIAGSLGLDMFKVDLSSVISRWVGETEKNLKEIFDAAEGGSSVVLFDEADSLFGSRGDVKQAQDRFANQEVSFLLQRLEVFEGCAVLTTNLQENIDEAFLRRFGAVIEFRCPPPPNDANCGSAPSPNRHPAMKTSTSTTWRDSSRWLVVRSSTRRSTPALSPPRRTHPSACVTWCSPSRELYKMGKQINEVHFGDYYDDVKDLF